MSIWANGCALALPTSSKCRAMLAVVALAGPAGVPRYKLSKLLWGDRGEKQAQASIRQEVHHLVKYMTDMGLTKTLSVTRELLSFVPGHVWTDVDEVMLATLERPAAVSLLNGVFLDGLDGLSSHFDVWLAAQRERLRDHARGIAETLLDDSTPSVAIETSKRLLAIDGLHEGAARMLMRGYLSRGERGLAADAYESCRKALAAGCGAVPSVETQQLAREIRGGLPIDEAIAVTLVEKPLIAGDVSYPATSMMVPDVRFDLLSQRFRGNRAADGLVPFRATAEKGAKSGVGAGDLLPKPKAASGMASATGYRPICLGVVSFRLIAADSVAESLAAALEHELTTSLSRLSWLRIVSSAALRTFLLDDDLNQVARGKHGVDLLIDGSVQVVGDRLRVTLQLVDLRDNDRIVWGRRFDRDDGDCLSMQDWIASVATAQIDSEVFRLEILRAQEDRIEGASAADLVLCSLPFIRLEYPSFMKAGVYLSRAISAEPDYAPAYAWSALWHAFLFGQGWARNPVASMEKSVSFAERAITLDPFDARALTIAAHVRAFLQKRLEDAAVLHERALSVNSNLALAWTLSAVTHSYLGDTQEAERRIGRRDLLSPMDTLASLFDSSRTLIHVLRGDYKAAAVAGRITTGITPGLSSAFKPYIAALGYLGCVEEASAAREKLLAIEPGFTVDRYVDTSPLQRKADRDRVVEGLRLANVPALLGDDGRAV
jgi:DNA-binding SARP family transcriptional activator/TolB-like protein